jgi:hypothetical protein
MTCGGAGVTCTGGCVTGAFVGVDVGVDVGLVVTPAGGSGVVGAREVALVVADGDALLVFVSILVDEIGEPTIYNTVVQVRGSHHHQRPCTVDTCHARCIPRRSSLCQTSRLCIEELTVAIARVPTENRRLFQVSFIEHSLPDPYRTTIAPSAVGISLARFAVATVRAHAVDAGECWCNHHRQQQKFDLCHLPSTNTNHVQQY